MPVASPPFRGDRPWHPRLPRLPLRPSQGGANAGHTIYDSEGNKYKLHLIPSGILNPKVCTRSCCPLPAGPSTPGLPCAAGSNGV